MKNIRPRNLLPAASIVIAIGFFAAGTGVAFSAWMEKGAAIFLTYAETGLSWCF